MKNLEQVFNQKYQLTFDFSRLKKKQPIQDDTNPFVKMMKQPQIPKEPIQKKEPNTYSFDPAEMFKSLNIRCKCNKPVVLYCCSQNCAESAMICSNSESQCMNRHEDCTNTIVANHFHNKITKKVVSQKEHAKHILEEIQKVADKMTDEVSLMMAKLEEKFKTFRLNTNELDILQRINEKFTDLSEQPTDLQEQPQVKNIFQTKNAGEKLKGDHFYKFNLRQKDSEKKWVNQSLDRYKQVITSTRVALNQHFEEIQRFLDQLHYHNLSQKSLNEMFLGSRIVPTVPYHRPYQTNEMLDLTVFERLRGILQSRIQLAYLQKIASHSAGYPFDMKKFFTDFQGKENLLILVKTHDNEVCGCFVPEFKIGDYISSEKAKRQQNFFIFNLSYNLSESLGPQSTISRLPAHQNTEKFESIEFGTQPFEEEITSKKQAFFRLQFDPHKDIKIHLISQMTWKTIKEMEENRSIGLKMQNILTEKDLISKKFPIAYKRLINHLEVYQIQLKKQKNSNPSKQTIKNMLVTDTFGSEEGKTETNKSPNIFQQWKYEF